MTKDNTPLSEPGLVFDEEMDMNPDVSKVKPVREKEYKHSSESPKTKNNADLNVDENDEIDFVLEF